MKLSEFFISIQGESIFSGFPFVFIRLSGCNLRCRYCDTKYAWEDGKEVPLEKVIDKTKKAGFKKVLITGGEPLIQKDSLKLMEELASQGFQVLLETNGSLPIKDVPRKVHIVMDIKTPGSGEEDSFLWDNLKYLKKSDEIKVVLVDRDDYIWFKSVMRRLPKGVLINLSPAWGFLKPGDLANWILEDRLNVRLNLQIHKYLWGDARGR